MGSVTSEGPDGVTVRDAATIVVLRDAATRPAVLMGQRGRGAIFMPGKFVFPGGAVDRADAAALPRGGLPDPCRRRLSEAHGGWPPEALAAAAIRELWEETGQVLGRAGPWPDPPPNWRGFAAAGFRPDASRLSFIFRAVTPPGRPRRFDARFFLVDASALVTDPDEFRPAFDELSQLQWVPLEDARRFDLPFVTEVVLAEIMARLPDTGPPDTVPYFRQGAEEAAFVRLGGRAL